MYKKKQLRWSSVKINYLKTEIMIKFI